MIGFFVVTGVLLVLGSCFGTSYFYKKKTEKEKAENDMGYRKSKESSEVFLNMGQYFALIIGIIAVIAIFIYIEEDSRCAELHYEYVK